MNVFCKIILFICVLPNISYAQDGEIHFGYVDKDSLKQGLWGNYDSISGINTIETYINDTLNGFTTMTSGKFLNEINYKKGLKNGWVREYFKGVLSEAILYNSGFIVYVRLYDFKGRIQEEYGVKNGKKEGVRLIYKKGKIKYKEFLKNDINEGKVIFYYKKYGTPHYVYDYKNGKKTGSWIELDKDGYIINSNQHK